ncbi:MAG: hypothetical protein VB025_07425, partial [Sphaerochaeta sp.]|nr:hypothetical protein [Sphaerochaeta sp.]
LYVNGIPEISDPSLTEEVTVIDPEALSQEYPEIVKLVEELVATESEIPVPVVEDAPEAEEKVTEAEESAEGEFHAELVKLAREGEPEEKASETEKSESEKAFIDKILEELNKPINTRPEITITEIRNETPVPGNDLADPEHDRRVRKDVPFYLTLQNIIDRYEAGDIVFEGMTLNESKGVLYIEYASA